MEKFLFLTDLHWGYERRGGHKVAVHDIKAINVALQFAKDFKPDHVILGGDALDCRAISHHTKNRPGEIEGLRILSDAKELRSAVLDPLEALKAQSYTFIEGNHENWLNDLVTVQPGLEGIVDPASLLQLDQWKVVPNGGAHRLGKLWFVHGDQVAGGEHMAKAAVVNYERNIRFGHFHTFQIYTKTTPTDANGHTGMAVPCLCKKDPSYGVGRPNKWMQGFLYGYVKGPQGRFNDYPVVIVDGQAMIQGKLYKE